MGFNSPFNSSGGSQILSDLDVDRGTLSIDETNNRVGIGTTAPDGRLHVMKGSAGSVTASGDGNALVVESDDVAGMTLLSPGDGVIYFGDAADNDEGRIAYKHSDNSMNLWTNNAVRLTIDSSGDATFSGAIQANSTVTVGTGAQADTYLNFDGNAVDFRIGVDDGNDQLEIGKGVAHGTTSAIIISSTPQVVTTTAFGQSTGGTFGTFSDGDATPSVGTGNLWKHHASTQTITMFDDGIAGQVINVISTAAITYDVTGTNLKGGSVDLVTASGDVTQWFFDGTNWYLTYFMDVSADHSVIGGGGGASADDGNLIIGIQSFS